MDATRKRRLEVNEDGGDFLALLVWTLSERDDLDFADNELLGTQFSVLGNQFVTQTIQRLTWLNIFNTGKILVLDETTTRRIRSKLLNLFGKGIQIIMTWYNKSDTFGSIDERLQAGARKCNGAIMRDFVEDRLSLIFCHSSQEAIESVDLGPKDACDFNSAC